MVAEIFNPIPSIADCRLGTASFIFPRCIGATIKQNTACFKDFDAISTVTDDQAIVESTNTDVPCFTGFEVSHVEKTARKAVVAFPYHNVS